VVTDSIQAGTVRNLSDLQDIHDRSWSRGKKPS